MKTAGGRHRLMVSGAATAVAAVFALGAVSGAAERAAATTKAKRPAKTKAKATTTTAPPAVAFPPVPADAGPAPFAARGPYAVGVRTLTVGTTPVEIWYPLAEAPPADAAKATYDLKEFLPPEVRAKLGDQPGAAFSTDAFRDRVAAPGPFPLLVFSHGFAGYRVQSAFLTTHLASWGFVVAAPEHQERNLSAVLAPGGLFRALAAADVADLQRTIDALLAKGAPVRVDPAQIGALGHSAGANAAVRLAANDARVRTVVALAGGGTSLLGAAPDPKKPVLYMAGALDKVIPPAGIEAGYAKASRPKRYLVIDGAGHLAFSDICTIARDRGGVIESAKALGIDVPGTLVELGSDGCNPPALPVVETWPLIRHFSVAHFRATLGRAPVAVGLDAPAARAFAPVTTTLRSE